MVIRVSLCQCNTMRSDVPELSSELVNAVDSMPAFPESAQRILRLTRDASCAPKDLVEVIDRDPVVTVKVLRVVNSAYYSLPRKISSISHAVVFLGFNTVKNLSLSIAAVGMLPTNPLAGFDGKGYLLHSLTAAGIARQLAMKIPGADPHDFFIAGLLHDFGKVVIAQGMPIEFKKALEFSVWHEVSLHCALRDVVGIDHSAVGALLLEKWQFPVDLVEAVRYQHQVELKDSDLIAGVYTANQICRHLGVDFGGPSKREDLPANVAHRMGGNLDQIIAQMGDLKPLLEEARRFIRI
jgi:putative nucleotidyltransferase with HDIG domain